MVRLSYIINVDEKIDMLHKFSYSNDILSRQWDLLLREYHEAAGYIEDLKDICVDFEGLCQRNLSANAGNDS